MFCLGDPMIVEEIKSLNLASQFLFVFSDLPVAVVEKYVTHGVMERKTRRESQRRIYSMIWQDERG